MSLPIAPARRFVQAERDLDQARASQVEGRHEWACFAAQQSAEKAVKSVIQRESLQSNDAREVQARGRAILQFRIGRPGGGALGW